MSKTKAGGSSKNGRDSNPQFLGVKIFAGQQVTGGEILVHLRGDRVVAANSKLVLALDVSTTPTLSAADAEQQARDLMRRLYPERGEAPSISSGERRLAVEIATAYRLTASET